MSHRCEYCRKEFKRESSLAAHMCEKKRRYLQKDEQHVKLGLKMFNDWYHIAMGASGQKDYNDFMRSQYYGAFVRFGLYILEARVFAPERYLQWLIKTKVPVDRWCKDSVYSEYLAEQSKHETAERALERFVLHAEKWSERTGRHWSEYWRAAPTHVVVNDIKMGRISPWVFLGYDEAKAVLDDMPMELLNDVADTIDLGYWKRKIDVNGPTVEWLNQILSSG